MTLIELLVAMSISLVISAMILLSWFALSRSYATTTKREMASDTTGSRSPGSSARSATWSSLRTR